MVTTNRQFKSYLSSLGFNETKLRRRGSHNCKMQHPDGRFVRIAGQNAREISGRFLKECCCQAQIDVSAAMQALM